MVSSNHTTHETYNYIQIYIINWLAVQFRCTGRITKTLPHLSTSNSEHLSERQDGTSTMEVHEVLQEAVTPALPDYDVFAVLQCVNHEMSAAVLSTEGVSAHEGKRENVELLDSECNIIIIKESSCKPAHTHRYEREYPTLVSLTLMRK